MNDIMYEEKPTWDPWDLGRVWCRGACLRVCGVRWQKAWHMKHRSVDMREERRGDEMSTCLHVTRKLQRPAPCQHGSLLPLLQYCSANQRK
jgi:hypothetical protein